MDRQRDRATAKSRSVRSVAVLSFSAPVRLFGVLFYSFRFSGGDGDGGDGVCNRGCANMYLKEEK